MHVLQQVAVFRMDGHLLASSFASRRRSARMLRFIACLLYTAVANGHGSGAWKDPNHYDESKGPYAGLRYVSEGPPHKLTLVGSDDGKTWFNVKGWCDGEEMTQIHFDFSPKGGPADASAKWVKASDGSVTLNWSDGNKWELLAPTFDSDLVKPPKACCNCACGQNSGQCGVGCSTCDCEGCCA